MITTKGFFLFNSERYQLTITVAGKLHGPFLVSSVRFTQRLCMVITLPASVSEDAP
ncbi:MAG: hypothetical protein AB7G44_15900 [Bacteroidia bacterium]